MNLFGDPDPAAKRRQLDTAYQIFREVYNKCMKPDKYEMHVADFVQLSSLRRRLELRPGVTPPEWETACANYFKSPMGAYSLKDLAVRYAVFVRSPLDRFKMPVGVGDESRAERQLRDNKEAVRRSLDIIYGKAGSDARGHPDDRTHPVVSRTAVRLERKRNRKGIQDSS